MSSCTYGSGLCSGHRACCTAGSLCRDAAVLDILLVLVAAAYTSLPLTGGPGGRGSSKTSYQAGGSRWSPCRSSAAPASEPGWRPGGPGGCASVGMQHLCEAG